MFTLVDVLLAGAGGLALGAMAAIGIVALLSRPEPKKEPTRVLVRRKDGELLEARITDEHEDYVRLSFGDAYNETWMPRAVIVTTIGEGGPS